MSISLPTPGDLAQLAQASLRTSLDPSGTGRVDLHAGSKLDAFVGVGVALGTRVAAYAADRAAARILSSSEGGDLDELARDLWHEDRKPAAKATGKRRFARTGSAAATTIPKGTRVAVPATPTLPAVVFRVTEDVPVATAVTYVDVTVEAVETGIGGNLATPSLVSAILDPIPATSPASSWSLTDAGDAAAAVFGGGAPRETDDVLRERLGQYDPQSAQIRGTRDAILAGVLRVPGVRYATLVEPGNGTVVVFLGDAGYTLPAALRAAVDTELLSWRCFGVPVLLYPYSVSRVDVTMTVRMARALRSYDPAALRALFMAAIDRYFANRVSPDEYYRDAIEGAVFAAHPEVQTISTSAPSDDQPRPADSAYGTTMARFLPGSVQILLSDPLTA